MCGGMSINTSISPFSIKKHHFHITQYFHHSRNRPDLSTDGFYWVLCYIKSMKIFDTINRLAGWKTSEDRRKEESARRSRAIDKYRAEYKGDPAKAKVYIAPKNPQPEKFKPTPNDPEYYAQNGSAKNEAESQAMVNAYRERKSPGIKQQYPTVSTPKPIVKNEEPVVKPKIRPIATGRMNSNIRF